MTEKENTLNTSNFKFVVYQGKDKIIERIFNAELFNPIIRYSVDIRSMIPSITQRLQKVMSRRNLNYVDYGYNYLNYYEELTNFYKVNNNKLSKPYYTKYTHGDKVIKGVECKFGLYINDNPIVERKIYVDNYNPACRFSSEINDLIFDITTEIHESLKELDVEHMWGDYILINTYGLYHNQIRELSKKKRRELVDNFNDRSFVKRYITSFRSQKYSSNQ
jgi:hypothetical protein